MANRGRNQEASKRSAGLRATELGLLSSLEHKFSFAAQRDRRTKLYHASLLYSLMVSVSDMLSIMQARVTQAEVSLISELCLML